MLDKASLKKQLLIIVSSILIKAVNIGIQNTNVFYDQEYKKNKLRGLTPKEYRNQASFKLVTF